MPRSLEERRRAVVAALRAVAGEPAPPAPPAMSSRTPDRELQERINTLAGHVGELMVRLSTVETALLESTWERPAATESPEDADAPSDRPSVPAVPLAEGRLSTVAAQALFGH